MVNRIENWLLWLKLGVGKKYKEWRNCWMSKIRKFWDIEWNWLTWLTPIDNISEFREGKSSREGVIILEELLYCVFHNIIYF